MLRVLTIFVLLFLAGCGGNPPVVVIPPVPPPVVVPEPPPIVVPEPLPIVAPQPPPMPEIPDWILADYPDARQVWFGTTAVMYVSGGFALDDVRKYVNTALADTQKLRPAAKLEGMFVVKEMPNDCPRSSGPAFFADGVMDSREVTGMRQWYPQSFVNNRPCVHGYFGSRTIPPVIYVPTGLPEVIEHEVLHGIWWSNWVGEKCGGDFVWAVVEHGGACDPFSGEK